MALVTIYPNVPGPEVFQDEGEAILVIIVRVGADNHG
jgi:hypothetical protein